MLNVLKDKRIWIGLIAIAIIITGIVCAVFLMDKFGQQDGNKNPDKEIVIDDDIPYDEEGMEVVDDGKTQEDSMEVPKSWEGSSADENATDNTDSKEEGNTSDDNTLKDDTSWGTIF